MKLRRLLCLLPLLVCATVFAEEKTPTFSPDITVDDLRAHLEHIASDAMGGRETLSPDSITASAYIAGHWERSGVTPMGADGSWFQPYSIKQPVLNPGNRLVVYTPDGSRECAVEKDWNPFSVTPPSEIKGDVVFAGYGITAPGRQYDDYAGVDVKDKIVLIFRKNPGWRERQHASFMTKLTNAVKHGAKAVLLCNDPATVKSAKKDTIFSWRASLGPPTGSAAIPYAFITQDVAAAMLKQTGRSLEEIEALLKTQGPQSAALDQIQVELKTTKLGTKELPARNVVGFLLGSDPELNQEVVVLGAHFDHVGDGRYGSMSNAVGQIHNGADDNGSGTVTLIELAAWFGRPENRPRRSLVLVAFSGEERGLLGSRYYVNHPTVPLDDIVAMINMDMVGRSRGGKLQIGGVGTAKGLRDLVAAHNKTHRLNVTWDPQGTAPSDSTSFFRKDLPVLFFFTGLHEDYHRPTDDPDKINYADMQRIALLVRDVAHDIACRDERLVFTKPPPRPRPPVLGISLSQEPNEHGLMVGGVTPNGPAAKGGMQAGDIIISLVGQAIRDRQGLMQVLGGLKPGKTVKIQVLREGERVTLEVTLGERPRRRRR